MRHGSMHHDRICRHGAGIHAAWTVLLVVGLQATVTAASIDVSPPRPIGKGAAVVLRPEASREREPKTATGDLLIHFHGAVDTIRSAMERAGTSATVIVVNQPGLSAAYAAPFRDDPDLFEHLLTEPLRAAGDGAGAPAPRWRRVTLSCFSAGYGAVREVLRDEHSAARVDAIVAADSIYAGLDEAGSADGVRRVELRDMAAFLAFARAAAAGEKSFLITHSAQPTPYASTTETADFLLDSLSIAREAVSAAAGEAFPQTSRAGRGRFEVLGFAGASGPAHLFHLRAIDRWWQAAERLADQHPAE